MKSFIYKNILPFLGFIFIKLISLTYRVRILNQENENKILQRGEYPIYISWHQRLFPGVTLLASRKPITIIVSQSRDGDLIAGILKLLGWHPVRGSSSKGGVKALREIKKLAKQGYSIGHIVDGPRGPSGVIKLGLLMIAKYSGMPILPVITSAQRKWVFNSWDRFMIPKPFSRILIKFDKEINIADDISKEKFEDTRLRLEERLEELYKEIDKIWLSKR